MDVELGPVGSGVPRESAGTSEGGSWATVQEKVAAYGAVGVLAVVLVGVAALVFWRASQA